MVPISNKDVEKKSSKGESFLKGTFILTVAGFVVKVIGSLNWIFVSRILGGEGIGLYQMAFPIYFFAMTVSQAGVPVAISIITAEKVAVKDIWGAKRVFHISMALMLVTGIVFSFLTYFGVVLTFFAFTDEIYRPPLANPAPFEPSYDWMMIFPSWMQ